MKNAKPFQQGMTLMPGESTVIKMSIPIQMDEMPEGFSGTFSLHEVPPPKEVPVQDEAERLGLVRGLRVSPAQGDMWRCAECSRMQKPDAPMVWVPDGVRKGDPEWSVTEACRRSAFNGHFGGWCVRCAPKASSLIVGSSKVAALIASDLTPAMVVTIAIVAFIVLGMLVI